LRLFALLLIAALLGAENVDYIAVKAPVIEERLKLASPVNATRAELLTKAFQNSGCTGDRLTEQTVSKKGQPNIICTLPGETDSVILVGAHFDTVKGSGGVADNWSGAILLPSLFETLRGTPRKHTYVFIGFTDEEKGLVGSRHYVRKLAREDAVRIKAMVNLDTLGLGPLNVWASHSDKALTNHLLAVSQVLKLQLSAIEIEGVGSADSESFAEARIPRITISSVTMKNLPILHSKADQLDTINLTSYYDSYRVIGLYLAYLDQKI
jgi:Zn-dependent M28 family amino/carboxypeptidase